MGQALEQYLPPRTLEGLLPAALLSAYDFYHDCSDVKLIRGYPQRESAQAEVDVAAFAMRMHVRMVMRTHMHTHMSMFNAHCTGTCTCARTDAHAHAQVDISALSTEERKAIEAQAPSRPYVVC